MVKVPSMFSTKSQRSREQNGGGLCLDPVIGVCKGTFPGRLVPLPLHFYHGHVFSIGGAVSSLRRTHT